MFLVIFHARMSIMMVLDFPVTVTVTDFERLVIRGTYLPPTLFFRA